MEWFCDMLKPAFKLLTSQKAIWELGWKVIPYPPYSPNLGPGFHLFRSLLNNLQGIITLSNLLGQVFTSKPPDIFTRETEKLPGSLGGKLFLLPQISSLPLSIKQPSIEKSNLAPSDFQSFAVYRTTFDREIFSNDDVVLQNWWNRKADRSFWSNRKQWGRIYPWLVHAFCLLKWKKKMISIKMPSNYAPIQYFKTKQTLPCTENSFPYLHPSTCL